MSETVISVEGLSKRYLIAHNSERQGHKRYIALRDVIGRELWNIARKTRHMLQGRQVLQGNRVEEFWALKDVSFEVKQGEVIGIIGRNGAGKSTLLKILSRITEPTEGRVVLRGRVASLLEVGTGFHPELTGRENIYLNGAILGMTRREIRSKFDEIVAFAEVEKFLDTPVKHYSSGMYVRLAFAVAAHLEPEILIVDEVLAVGDFEFQKKCLGKMSEVADGGRTVLFVSHNMAALARLCGPALWLAGGAIISQGPVHAVARDYLAASSGMNAAPSFSRRNTGEHLRIDSVQLFVGNAPSTIVQAGQSCQFHIHYSLTSDRLVGPISCSILLFSNGEKLTNLWTDCDPSFDRLFRSTPRKGLIVCNIVKWPFRNHTIRVDLYSHIGQIEQDWIEEAFIFQSRDGDFYGSNILTDSDQGILFVDHKWRLEHADQ